MPRQANMPQPYTALSRGGNILPNSLVSVASAHPRGTATSITQYLLRNHLSQYRLAVRIIINSFYTIVFCLLKIPTSLYYVSDFVC